MKKAIVSLLIALLALGLVPGFGALALAEEPMEDIGDLAMGDEFVDLSLEELMDIEVYSVSKKKQKLSESAAAVYVLSQEDIRRSGATTIMDALRLVPGVEVSNLNRQIYSISVRGFNDRFSNKLLVLIDGRSVYTPLFAGVYWDVQDTVLEDVERIEVVRGPGGTLWGANAVNGVINIITKSARDTQGTLASATIGNEELGTYTVRQGMKFGENGGLRLYAKYFTRDDFEGQTDGEGRDSWSNGRAGFRSDFALSDTDEATVQGEFYSGDVYSQVQDPIIGLPYVGPVRRDRSDYSGGHLIARWSRDLGEGERVEVQAYYDRTDRQADGFNYYRDTVDVDFQHMRPVTDNMDLIWGANYRYHNDDSRESFQFALNPVSRDTQVFSGFIQNEFRLFDEKLRLTLGSKFEHNDYSGFEYQPSGRFLLKATETQTVWGAVSRAVRTPSRVEQDITINAAAFPSDPTDPTSVPVLAVIQGDRSFDAEDLTAFELGYRASLAESVSIDVAAFYNDYENLRSIVADLNPDDTLALVPSTDPLPFHLKQISRGTNQGEGTAWGAEVGADYVVNDTWRLRAGYSYLQLDIDEPANALDTGVETSSPHNRAFLRSLATLPGGIEFDTTLRYVDSLSTVSRGVRTRVSSYVTADVRVAYELMDGLEISIVGQNLLEAEHPEFGESPFAGGAPTEVERSVYGRIVWER